MSQDVAIPAGSSVLKGLLSIPQPATGIVLFAHGSGSGRLSPRNQLVAGRMNEAGMATLLFDLLTSDEERIDARTRSLRFDIELLAERLESACDWCLRNPPTAHLPVGYFGASTGTAAALVAAANRPGSVHAVVSRGGRPDLAGAGSLRKVQAPTLLIVGGLDDEVIALNRHAMAQMRATAALEIVPGATHLFEEPGTLDQVARLARDWFQTYLHQGAAAMHT